MSVNVIFIILLLLFLSFVSAGAVFMAEIVYPDSVRVVERLCSFISGGIFALGMIYIKENGA